VGDADRFCAKCGAVQHASGAPRASSASDPISNISSRNASLLCYIPYVGWIAAIVVLASERFRRDPHVRFHAFQGLYLFVAWLIVDWVLSPVLSIGDGFGVPFHHVAAHVLQLLIFVAWIVMMIKVSHDEHYHLPILGDLAERSVSEQRS
jgi:uncharacterized membrane protein